MGPTTSQCLVELSQQLRRGLLLYYYTSATILLLVRLYYYAATRLLASIKKSLSLTRVKPRSRTYSHNYTTIPVLQDYSTTILLYY